MTNVRSMISSSESCGCGHQQGKNGCPDGPLIGVALWIQETVTFSQIHPSSFPANISLMLCLLPAIHALFCQRQRQFPAKLRRLITVDQHISFAARKSPPSPTLLAIGDPVKGSQPVGKIDQRGSWAHAITMLSQLISA